MLLRRNVAARKVKREPEPPNYGESGVTTAKDVTPKRGQRSGSKKDADKETKASEQ